MWESYGDFILSDVSKALQDNVKKFVVKNFIEENPICRMMKFTEEENYADAHNLFIDHILHDQSSVVLLNTQTDEIVAAAIMKPMTKEMKSWTAIRLIPKTRKLRSLLGLINKMICESEDLLNHPTCTMHIFELCAPQGDPQSSTQLDWIPILFHGAYRVGQSMQMPLITFVALSLVEQAAAVAAGFTEVSRIFYPTYVEIDGHRPIPPSDIGEMYAILYVKKIQPFIPYHELP